MSDDPTITYNKDGHAVSFAGREAVEVFRVASLISAIRFSLKTGGKMQITRGFTLTKGLKMASQYTGRPYKRTEAELAG